MAIYGRVVIAGLGLIGGSLGLAIRRQGLAKCVVGLARRRQTADRAIEVGAVDEVSFSPEEAAESADLLVLAAPVMASISLARVMVPLLPSGSTVTDVCSSKRKLLEAVAGVLPEGVSLIGGHPMAGLEKAGIAYASADLFQGARYLLLPVLTRDSKALDRLLALLKALGAVPEQMDADEHDALTALVSHLPHVVAQCLVGTMADQDSQRVNSMAAGGFRDITRVAGSDPRMWNDIYLSNHDQVLRAVELFRLQLDRLAAMIRSGDEDALVAWLTRVRDFREGLGR